jgi:hypothetical protein
MGNQTMAPDNLNETPSTLLLWTLLNQLQVGFQEEKS